MAYINGSSVLINLKYSNADEEKEVMNRVWNAIQAGGTRTRYSYAFTRTAYNKESFKPVHSFKPTEVADMFSYIDCDSSETVDMAELEAQQGIIFDFSECTAFTRTFAGGLFSVLNIIDLSKAASLQYTFYGGYGDKNLKRIERLICSETTTFHSSTFNLQSNLEYIGFEGTIAKNGLNLSASPKLTHESLIKLIACLKDYSDDQSGTSWVVTLGEENLSKLTNEEIATATEKGWTLA